jgi:hypothetical protein
VRKINTRLGLAVVAAAGVVGAVALTGGPASADAATHTSFPAAGAVFSCSDTSYTAVSGTVKFVYQENQSASGIFEVTGTITPTGVTLQDAAGNLYKLSGAGWFGGTFNPATNTGQFTDTEKFQIIDLGGGVVGTVNIVEHMSPNGKIIDFNFGNCTPPPED